MDTRMDNQDEDQELDPKKLFGKSPEQRKELERKLKAKRKAPNKSFKPNH